jgi:hypothetical protein
MDNKTSNINKRGAIAWNTTIFMIIFHAGAVAALFMLSWKVIGQPGYRDGLSSAVNTPRL